MPQTDSPTTNSLMEKIKAMKERAKQRREQESLPLSPEAPPISTPPAKGVNLPIWPEAMRAVPNGVLRSALFGAIRRGARRYMERERIAALEGIEIFYTGQRLDQGDLDVWETALHAVRLQSLGNECRVTAYQILKALGKTDSGCVAARPSMLHLYFPVSVLSYNDITRELCGSHIITRS
jgi:hypothetical protein